ncbi:MAG: glycerophosphoryl diester phosphodiesterase [Alphaproteobacteria bacterium]|nr:glycerophosphoryl diester phosphodiesterase [Alphaproteobacteria bacterium]
MDKKVFAHRGMSSLAPENTLAAFALCKTHGITWFECDIDVIADGTIILTHDTTLDRCTNKIGGYYHLKQADLLSIDNGSWFADEYSAERIPTIESLFKVMQECNLSANIEIKSNEHSAAMAQTLIKNLAAAIEKSGLKSRIIVSSFNHALLGDFKKLCDVAVACLFETHTLYDDWKSTMQWVGAEYIHPQNEGLTKAHVDMFKGAGYKVNVWTVNKLDRANQLFNWGVDGVFTDIAQSFPSKYKTNK